MKSKSTKVMKEVKAIKYTFELEKHNYGLHKICNDSFTSPNSDGIRIGELMAKLPEGQRLTVTVIIPEE